MTPARPTRLRLLGTVSLVREDGAPLHGPAAQRHRLALLALLALAGERGFSREKLMAYLWPDRDGEHARQLLKQAVYSVRKAIGDDVLVTAGDSLHLNPAVVRADATEFEAALARGEHEAAAGLYRGTFLDGFFLADAPEFERWAAHERDRLAASYARALEALAGSAEGAGDFGRAAAWWQARAAHDPYDSRVSLRLMQALAASGNPAGALQHAKAHARLLREEFAMEPTGEVLVLAERLRGGPRALAGPLPDRPAVAGDGTPSASSQPLPPASRPLQRRRHPMSSARRSRRPLRDRGRSHPTSGAERSATSSRR
jgi:DNA-binding SARP family transcriptional activator